MNSKVALKTIQRFSLCANLRSIAVILQTWVAYNLFHFNVFHYFPYPSSHQPSQSFLFAPFFQPFFFHRRTDGQSNLLHDGFPYQSCLFTAAMKECDSACITADICWTVRSFRTKSIRKRVREQGRPHNSSPCARCESASPTVSERWGHFWPEEMWPEASCKIHPENRAVDTTCSSLNPPGRGEKAALPSKQHLTLTHNPPTERHTLRETWLKVCDCSLQT